MYAISGTTDDDREVELAGEAVAALELIYLLADRPVAPYQPTAEDEAEAAAIFGEIDTQRDAREAAEWEMEQDYRLEASAAIDRACGVPTAFAGFGHDG